MARKTSKPYDVTLKDLVRLRPRDALALIGLTDVIDVQPEDAELSTLVAAADKVLRVRVPLGEFLVHFEFQSGQDGKLPERIFWYNAALYHQHRLPVLSVVVLLTEKADSPGITGVFEVKAPPARPCITFRYEVVRLWRTPVETILKGGVGLLPLAPLCQGAASIEAIVAKIDERFRQELPPQDEGKFWLATCTLMGLRYDAETVFRLIPKGRAMKESTTYQAIVEEGRQNGRQEGRQEGEYAHARSVLLRLGRKHLGPPGLTVRDRLDALTDIEAIDLLIDRVDEVATWEELLPPSTSPRPKPRKKKP